MKFIFSFFTALLLTLPSFGASAITDLSKTAPQDGQKKGLFSPNPAPAVTYSYMPPSVYFFNHIHSWRNNEVTDVSHLRYYPCEIRDRVASYLSPRGGTGIFAITDHNSDESYDDMYQAGCAGETGGAAIAIRGVEFSEIVHLGVVGFQAKWTLGSYDRTNYPTMVSSNAHLNGIRIINHPAQSQYDWPLELWSDAEAVEIWSTDLAIKTEANKLGVQRWHTALANGSKYTAVAGSDFHQDIPGIGGFDVMLFPANIVFSPDNNPENVLRAIKAGKVSVLTATTSPKVYISAAKDGNAVAMGDTMQATGPVEIRVSIDRTDSAGRNGFECRIFTSASATQPAAVLPVGKAVYDEIVFTLNISGKDFARAELWSTGPMPRPAAFTNPVYFN